MRVEGDGEGKGNGYVFLYAVADAWYKRGEGRIADVERAFRIQKKNRALLLLVLLVLLLVVGMHSSRASGCFHSQSDGFTRNRTPTASCNLKHIRALEAKECRQPTHAEQQHTLTQIS